MDKRDKWEGNWSRNDFDPTWYADELPEPVENAIRGGWWLPGMRLLDLGCGDGRIAAWLAERGFVVTGIDFSDNAIARARDQYRDRQGLDFHVVDACGQDPGLGKFEALLDRGCLHTIPMERHREYAGNLMSWSAPGAKLLLIVEEVTTPFHERVREAREILEPGFTLRGARRSAAQRPTTGAVIRTVSMRLVRT
jgi:cyclopropane fatty-acyl-phospholipid synthase-like methyltransferase